MAWQVSEDGLEPVTCATLIDARQHVAERASDVWHRLVDPNGLRRVFPSINWDIEARDNEPVVVGTITLPDGSDKEWEIRHD